MGGIAFTLRSRDYKDQQGVITERQMNEEVFEIGNGQARNTEIHEVCETLDCMHDQKALLIRGYGNDEDHRKSPERFESEVCGHVSDVEQPYGDWGGNTPMVMEEPKTIVRRLTPLECERLQGFPDNWTKIGEWTDSKGKKHKEADSPRYKALGNAIALPFGNGSQEGWSVFCEPME